MPCAGAAMSRQGFVVDGGYGVVTISEGVEDYDYYPVIWDGTPYEIEEDGLYDVVGQDESVMLSNGEFVCKAFWMYKIDGAPQWYTPSDAPAFVRMQHVLAPNLELTPIGEECWLPSGLDRRLKQKLTELGALRIHDHDHVFLIEESIQRGQIEFQEDELDEMYGNEDDFPDTLTPDEEEDVHYESDTA